LAVQLETRFTNGGRLDEQAESVAVAVAVDRCHDRHEAPTVTGEAFDPTFVGDAPKYPVKSTAGEVEAAHQLILRNLFGESSVQSLIGNRDIGFLVRILRIAELGEGLSIANDHASFGGPHDPAIGKQLQCVSDRRA
jgi:hypothetical protein